MPVPEPMAPRKSANTDRAPMHRPPNAAAVGMYLQDRMLSQSVQGRGRWGVIVTLPRQGAICGDDVHVPRAADMQMETLWLREGCDLDFQKPVDSQEEQYLIFMAEDWNPQRWFKY